MSSIAPQISVLLPVYNGEKTIARAIESILNQDFKDFELIILDDGSKDKTLDICKDYQKKDSRIILVHHENKGLSATLNIGISLARGELIARQDSDDCSLPDRLEKQLNYMRANSKTVLLGTWAKIFVDDMDSGRRHNHPTKNKCLRLFLYFDNPFVHSSVIMRKDALRAAGGYVADIRHHPEDYDLWTRIANFGEIENLPYYGIEYHEVPLSISRIQKNPFPLIYEISKRYFLNNTKSTPLLSHQWAKFIWNESKDFQIMLLIVCFLKIIYREKIVTVWFLNKMFQLLKVQISQTLTRSIV